MLSRTMGIEMEGMLDTYEHYKEGNNAILDYLKEYPTKMIDEKGGAVAGYGNRIRAKYTAKWGVQIAGMIFQTGSKVYA